VVTSPSIKRIELGMWLLCQHSLSLARLACWSALDVLLRWPVARYPSHRVDLPQRILERGSRRNRLEMDFFGQIWLHNGKLALAAVTALYFRDGPN
jgi:hypothetical protein